MDWHARRTSLLATGLSTKLKCTSFVNPLSGSRSANSATAFSLSTSVDRFGMLLCRSRCTELTLLRARYRLLRRGFSGKFDRVLMSLSVKSMASCSFATPRFSIVGILWPGDGDGL